MLSLLISRLISNTMSGDSEELRFCKLRSALLDWQWIDVRIVLSVSACRVLIIIVAFLTDHTNARVQASQTYRVAPNNSLSPPCFLDSVLSSRETAYTLPSKPRLREWTSLWTHGTLFGGYKITPSPYLTSSTSSTSSTPPSGS